MKKPDFRKLYKELFYIPKHEKLPEKVFRCRIATSVLTMFACVTVMMSSAFAFFSMDVSTNNSTLTGAYFSVTVNDAACDDTYICPLAYEDMHVFVIEPAGTASKGYCEIQIGDDVYYTGQLTTGSVFTLTVQAAVDTPILFTPYWGSNTVLLSENLPENGAEIYHSTTPYAVYVVEEGATLTGIAEYYGVTEEDILIYNNLLEIPAGIELKIPGVDPDIPAYEAPVEDEESSSAGDEPAAGEDTPGTDGSEPGSEPGEEPSGDGEEPSSGEDTPGTDGSEPGSESGEEPSGDGEEPSPGEDTPGNDGNASGGGTESSGSTDNSSADTGSSGSEAGE